MGGIAQPSGAVVAGVIGLLGIVYVVTTDVIDLGRYYALISGLGLILTAIFNPVGIASAMAATRDRLWRARVRRPVGTAEVEGVTHAG
jgi:branched-chain amino acid transport system permease protein